METIYLDNNATTKIDEEVLKAMLPYMTEIYGNASSVLNSFGQAAAKAVVQSQNILADCFDADSKDDFIFTSGATESNNLAISGVIQAYHKKNPHIIVSTIEHPSILQVCKYWEKHGVTCTYLPVDQLGRVCIGDVEAAIRENTILISVMSANNEIGTIQPIEEIGQIARKNGIFFHTDATQYLYYKIINVRKLPVDLISFSGHKIHGPKGIGALYVNSRVRRKLMPQIRGGGQQKNLRSGTLNVAGIVGLAKAVEILTLCQEETNRTILELRNYFLNELKKNHLLFVNGDLKNRLPNNLNLYFPNVSALQLASNLPNLAFSMGSACSSEKGESSHVLKEIRLGEIDIRNSLRFGLSKYTTFREIDMAVKSIDQVLNDIKEDKK